MEYLTRLLVLIIVGAIALFVWFASGERCLAPLLVLGLALFLYLLANPGPNVIPVDQDKEEE